ncbi:alanine--tRNA ligase-related protein, partial [Porphyromonas loveana]|uniref:alanine--tRNA ligase-related protein n=1 Tax=Porphyromonas loveana TaxID=1884669 RepID=UPI0035A047AC
TEILRYRLVKQKNKEYYQVVLSDTPFYAEMGGQVGDSGQLIDESGVAYDIFDTKRENNLPVHLMKKLPESTTDTFVARIHEEKRRQAEANHTATHLMHEALRDVLGSHVEQKGSFVSPEVLRFDFSHFGKMSVEEIRKVEELVAQRIRADYRREEFRDVPIAEAQAMGAMALFGEKYGEEVRVMKYGSSVELCGGTHIPSTGMIGTFRIVSESSIASGIRRIEAVTGANAERLTYEREDILLAIKELFNNNPNLIKSIEKMLEEDIQLKKQVADMKQERIARFKKTLLEQDIRRRGIRVFAIKELMQTEMMKDLAFQIAGEMTESFAIVAGTIESENKCALTVMLSKDLVESGMDAAKLVRNAAGLIQGGGGGQPHFATAGGKKSEGIHAAIEQILKEADLAN